MPSGPFTSPYQVKTDDKDLLTLSAKLQVDYNALKAANPYIHSISQGQYINIPSASPPGNLPYQISPFSEAVSQGARNLATNLFTRGDRRYPLYAQAPIYQPRDTAYPLYAQSVAQAQAAPRERLYPLYGSNIEFPSMGVSNTVGDITRPPSTAYNIYRPGRGRGASRGVAGEYQDYAVRSGLSRTNLDELGSQYAATGTLPPDLPPAVVEYLVSQGADPVLIQQAQQRGQQQAAMATDPLAGRPGHYYVDEKTAPMIGQIITRADGSRRRLLADKNGRLYYGKIGMNRRGRAKRRAQAAARAAQVLPSLEVRDAPVTALNVIMGS